MDYKFSLGIYNVASKDEAIDRINEMLDAYDFHVRPADDDIEINWLANDSDLTEL